VYAYPHVVVCVCRARREETVSGNNAITGRLARNGITAPPTRGVDTLSRSCRSGLCGKTIRKRRSDGVLCVVQSTCEEKNTPTTTMIIESDRRTQLRFSVFGAPEAAAKNTTARRTGLNSARAYLYTYYTHKHTSMSKYACATRISCTRPIRFVCVVEFFSCRTQGISAAYGGRGGWNAIFSVLPIIVEPLRWWRVEEVSIAASVHPRWCAYGSRGRLRKSPRLRIPGHKKSTVKKSKPWQVYTVRRPGTWYYNRVKEKYDAIRNKSSN